MENKDFAIKYKVVKITNDKYILFPMYLMSGESDAYSFKSEEGEELPVAFYKKDLKSKFVVDRYYDLDDLEQIYDYEYNPNDPDFLPQFYFENMRNTLIVLDYDTSGDGSLRRSEVNLDDFKERQFDLTFFRDRGLPVAAMNQEYLDMLMEVTESRELKAHLENLKTQMLDYQKAYDAKGITRIEVHNGKVKSIDVNKKVEGAKPSYVHEKDAKSNESAPTLNKDISYDGLCRHIKERVYGHDEEIDDIALVLYNNMTAKEEDGVDSFLITGPTGVGKTETIEAAAEYLGIPYMAVNAANLVPQGIKGTSLEDVLTMVYMKAGKDLVRAQRGLVFLDEFDKMNTGDFELKGNVKEILLTYSQGGTIPIENDHVSLAFDTKMLNKAYAGVFEKIRENPKVMGFGAAPPKLVKLDPLEIKNKIVEKQYFSEEEITRIPIIIAYNDLDRETKKQILLTCKSNALAKKRNRYMRDYGIDIIADEEFIDGVIDSIDKKSKGMRVANGIVTRLLNPAEKEILRNPDKGYKRLVLTKKTVANPKDFDLS